MCVCVCLEHETTPCALKRIESRRWRPHLIYGQFKFKLNSAPNIKFVIGSALWSRSINVDDFFYNEKKPSASIKSEIFFVYDFNKISVFRFWIGSIACCDDRYVGLLAEPNTNNNFLLFFIIIGVYISWNRSINCCTAQFLSVLYSSSFSLF